MILKWVLTVLAAWRAERSSEMVSQFFKLINTILITLTEKLFITRKCALDHFIILRNGWKFDFIFLI